MFGKITKFGQIEIKIGNVIVLEKIYSLTKAQKWLRSPSDDQGWFTLTHSKSGNFLSATSLDETIFEGKHLFTVLPRKKNTNISVVSIKRTGSLNYFEVF